MATTKLTAEQMLAEYGGAGLSGQSIEQLQDLMVEAAAGTGDPDDDGRMMQLSLLLDAVSKRIASGVKDRRYDAMIGVVGGSKDIAAGILFEVVAPTDYYSVDTNAVKKAAPRTNQNGVAITSNAMFYKIQHRDGYCKVSLV